MWGEGGESLGQRRGAFSTHHAQELWINSLAEENPIQGVRRNNEGLEVGGGGHTAAGEWVRARGPGTVLWVLRAGLLGSPFSSAQNKAA